MAVNEVIYNGQTLMSLKNDTVTAETLVAGATAHNAAGEPITGTLAANMKVYNLTLAKAYGWILLTTLDAEVLEHINDPSLLVSLVNVNEYAYTYYSGSMFFAGNRQMGVYGSAKNPVYGGASRETSETNYAFHIICAPANSTSTTIVSAAYAQFRLTGNKYYIQPGDGYLKAGNYRLIFTW